MLEGILIGVLVVLLVALFVISGMKRKKFNQELSQMRTDLKPGDKVMTDSGIVGEIVDSYQEEDHKYFVLKSGKDNNVGYFSVHANAIYYAFGKDAQQEVKTTVVEEKQENAEKVEVKEAKKSTSKKAK